MDKAQAIATEGGLTLMEVLRRAGDYPQLKSVAGKLISFTAMIDEMRRQSDEMGLVEFYDYVCRRSGYVAMLQEKEDAESRGRLENVEELSSSIQAFLENDPEDPTLSGFLDEVALYTDLDGQEAGDNCVTLMTMHSAKGLEFPSVFVVGMEDGLFPGNRAMGEPEEMEEERRLCYVAMTRAKEKLTLTNARQRMLFGRTTPCMPSRFLKEIPEENMEWLGKPEPRHPGGTTTSAIRLAMRRSRRPGLCLSRGTRCVRRCPPLRCCNCSPATESGTAPLARGWYSACAPWAEMLWWRWPSTGWAPKSSC